jgi:hypothetical protein
VKIVNSAFLFLIFVSLPSFSRAQSDFIPPGEDAQERLDMMEADLDRMVQDTNNFDQLVPVQGPPPLEREEKITATMRNIAVEITLEFLFTQGNQTFEVIDETTGARISKLDYPLRGEIPIIKGEVTFLPRVSVGGKFATSTLRKKQSSDEDWDFWGWHNAVWSHIDYQVTNQYSKSKVEFYDLNLYYNLFDSVRDSPESLAASRSKAYNNFLIDDFSLDVFGGYQSYRGRYRTFDPMTQSLRFVGGSWWYDTTLPADIGLDSFYKIEYKGPRLGLRAAGSKGKVTTKINLSGAWLTTKAYGYWNLRDYYFSQTGKNGLGMALEIQTAYALTPSFSCGFGYDFYSYTQKKLKESGAYPGFSYSDADIIRNADCKVYGPKLLFKYIW